MNAWKVLARLVAAGSFALAASTAVVVTDAMHAGQRAQGLVASAPQPALAGVAIVLRASGPHRFYRYAYRGGRWLRFGVGYATAPGYAGGYYLGYAPPPIAFYPPPYYQRPYYAAYYGRPYWYAHHWRRDRYGYYGPPRYGWRR